MIDRVQIVLLHHNGKSGNRKEENTRYDAQKHQIAKKELHHVLHAGLVH